MVTIFARQAMLPIGWRSNVRIEVGMDGCFSAIVPDSSPDPSVLCADIVIPPQYSLHSHAFQRAMAGLAEGRSNPSDTFWTWRRAMYRLADNVTPEQMQDIATFLYMEMLERGYTQVAEFHYLHHGRGGTPYADRAEMSLRIVQAARNVGMGLTLLPTLYARSGFGAPTTLPQQQRFANTLQTLADIVSRVRQAGDHAMPPIVGVGLHSVRAVDIREVGKAVDQMAAGAPIHIHVAEQQAEVAECLQATGARPVEYLFDHVTVDARWCLVHATHLSATETTLIARSGAVAGLCPITEANLGDGLFPFPDCVAQGGRFGIGSDSNILISPGEELRLLEYGARLDRQQRCVCLPEGEMGSVGGYLYRAAFEGGRQACGLPPSGLVVGARADLCVLDPEKLSLPELQGDRILDSAIFACPTLPVRDVMCAGQWVVQDGRHPDHDGITRNFHRALAMLVAE
ncbi:formimidoylglutamate deiminase [Komagataeibacter diospyri]|uniref:N-formimino-L-glutamate deiminase n=1 Tax=Komagataeibacter diospyri TaxID=1932662 RepID=A0A4P5NXK0_9PROT|nr:formimidoylglutamate deiminase [Komagataeibacter diospyri]GCE82636.1 N-formimino-L-glutamate deiminase [Komagataeibacter diospyri]